MAGQDGCYKDSACDELAGNHSSSGFLGSSICLCHAPSSEMDGKLEPACVTRATLCT